MNSKRTAVPRSILRILFNAAEPVTRRHIAYHLGKRYLMRHDIKVLNRLVEIGFAMAVKRPMYEYLNEITNNQWYGPKPNFQQHIEGASHIWFYEISAEGAACVRGWDRSRSGQPAPQINQPTPQTDPTNSTDLTIITTDQPKREPMRFEFDDELDELWDDVFQTRPQFEDESEVEPSSFFGKLFGQR